MCVASQSMKRKHLVCETVIDFEIYSPIHLSNVCQCLYEKPRANALTQLTDMRAATVAKLVWVFGGSSCFLARGCMIRFELAIVLADEVSGASGLSGFENNIV